MEKRSSSRDAFSNWRVLFGISLSSVGVFLALLALSVNSTTARAAEANQSPKPIVIYSVHNDVSPAMRDVDPWPDVRVQEHEAAANWRVWTGSHKDQPDLVVQKGTLLGQLAPSIPAPILTFAGIPYPGVVCSCAPPDTNGEVGATQYVQIVNEGYQVFDKATGTSVLGPSSISSVWTGFGGVAKPAALVIQSWFTINSPIAGCLAICRQQHPTTNASRSPLSDATGTWNTMASI
jgi:hypothetical protein